MSGVPDVPKETRSGRIDLFAGLLALGIALALWIIAARAGTEIGQFGRNIDSGAYESMIALLVALPMAVCFFLAWLTGARAFRWLALGWPFGLVVLGAFLLS